jgi:hypothetical protein
MALVVKDRVQETTTTSGTGTLTLSGAVPGYQTFSTAIGNTNTTFYTIYDNVAQVWEVGIGTVGAGTLARTTVLSNSSGTTSPITLAGNPSFVFCTYPAEQSINYDANNVATIGETLSYSDTGIIGSFASTVAGYNQVIVQNKSSATNASANLNVSNNTSTASTGFAELGINSSTFSGTGSFNIAGASYLASASTDLTIGTYGAYNVHFVTNSNTTDAMTIFNSGGVSLGGYGDPGIGTLYANNVYIGFNTITAAAGTTILTNASAGWQQVIGTTTQTIQLPNATTLYKGLAYTIANNSTGAVTIKNNASTTIDTTVTGGSSILVLTDNSTSAGTWVAYSYIPSSYDFSTTSANFGGATISNATWNGSTITSGYGGTGLTTFTAANNALYSTGASTLTAGTLPVAAGGTGATTLTGYVYGNGTGAFTASTTIPTSALTGSYVSTFSGGSTGLTPNTATTGAVTLAGTLAVAYGGTGQTTYTDGQLLIGNTSTTGLTKATLTGTTNQVTVTNGGGSITLSLPSSINVNTTGSAATLTTARSIYGNNFDGSANVTGIIASTYGGTGNGFTAFTGPTTSTKTFTLPNATATILTDNAAVTPAQGGTGQTTYTDGQLLIGNSTGNTLTKSTLTAGTGISITNGGGSISIASTVTSGLTISNDTTTATALYPTFTNATSGSITSASVTSTKFTFVPSTGTLTAPQVNASNGFHVNSKTVSVNYSIPSGSNAMSAGPITVNSGIVVTVPSGSRWVVL